MFYMISNWQVLSGNYSPIKHWAQGYKQECQIPTLPNISMHNFTSISTSYYDVNVLLQ